MLQRTFRWWVALFKNPYWWSGVAALVIATAALYVVLDDVLMPNYTRHGVSTTLKNVEGQQFAPSREQLANQGLRVKRQAGRYNPNVPLNEVVDQDPAPGSKVKPGRRVYLTVNSGSARQVSVPDVLTLSVRNATNELQTAGLQVDSVLVDTIPAENVGTVTRQKPPPGDTVDAGSGVRLWSARGLGDERIEIPNVYGLSVDRARRRLLRAQLRATVLDTTRSEEPDLGAPFERETRFVMGQRPLPGEELLTGRDVTLYVTSDSLRASRARPPAKDSTRRSSSSESTNF